jgi:hypothetical protein
LRLLETFEMGDLHVAIKNALRMGAIGFDAVKHLVYRSRKGAVLASRRQSCGHGG